MTETRDASKSLNRMWTCVFCSVAFVTCGLLLYGVYRSEDILNTVQMAQVATIIIVGGMAPLLILLYFTNKEETYLKLLEREIEEISR